MARSYALAHRDQPNARSNLHSSTCDSPADAHFEVLYHSSQRTQTGKLGTGNYGLARHWMVGSDSVCYTLHAALPVIPIVDSRTTYSSRRHLLYLLFTRETIVAAAVILSEEL